jgi:hypothetical protein
MLQTYAHITGISQFILVEVAMDVGSKPTQTIGMDGDVSKNNLLTILVLLDDT